MAKEKKQQGDPQAGLVVIDPRYGVIATHHQEEKPEPAAEAAAEPEAAEETEKEPEK